MSEAPEKSELYVAGPTPDPETPKQERPLLSVALGNVVLTEHGAEVTLVFPTEVVFADAELTQELENQQRGAPEPDASA